MCHQSIATAHWQPGPTADSQQEGCSCALYLMSKEMPDCASVNLMIGTRACAITCSRPRDGAQGRKHGREETTHDGANRQSVTDGFLLCCCHRSSSHCVCRLCWSRGTNPSTKRPSHSAYSPFPLSCPPSPHSPSCSSPLSAPAVLWTAPLGRGAHRDTRRRAQPAGAQQRGARGGRRGGEGDGHRGRGGRVV